MWVCVAACPAWRACISAGAQQGGEDGENAQQEEEKVVPFFGRVCTCTHERTALQMLGEMHS